MTGIDAEECRLLAAIHANPRDDGARMYYAEWLHTKGQSDRAELIRVSCEEASLPLDDPRRRALGARGDELKAKVYDSWEEDRPQEMIWPKNRFWNGIPLALYLFQFELLKDLTAQLNAAAALLNDRYLLSVNVDVSPLDYGIPLADQWDWWHGPFDEFMVQPAAKRACRLDLVFRKDFARRNSGLGPHYRKDIACNIVKHVAKYINPVRTPWVILHYASPSVRKLAEELLEDRVSVGYVTRPSGLEWSRLCRRRAEG